MINLLVREGEDVWRLAVRQTVDYVEGRGR